jgi:hypothetical protein
VISGWEAAHAAAAVRVAKKFIYPQHTDADGPAQSLVRPTYTTAVAGSHVGLAIFARGWGALAAVMEPIVDSVGSDVRAYLLRNAEAFVRWSVEHPAYSQLMFWRPVPGYEPSPEAYEPAVRLMERGRAALVAWRDRGALRAGADVDELVDVWTIVISGVVSQQLANAPTERFEDGRFTTLVPQVVEMYLRFYTP